jgi:hypothetical protein
MTTTSPPARPGAGALSCSDALEAGRPARRRRELVWGREIWWFNLTKNVRQRIRPRAAMWRETFSGTMVGIGRRPADADRMANRDRVGAALPATIILSGGLFYLLSRSAVCLRRSAIDGELSPHAKRRQTSVASHVASDGRAVGGGCVCEISDFASRHDSDAVGEFQYLVEVLRHQENGGASVTLLHDLRPNVGD